MWSVNFMKGRQVPWTLGILMPWTRWDETMMRSVELQASGLHESPLNKKHLRAAAHLVSSAANGIWVPAHNTIIAERWSKVIQKWSNKKEIAAI
jgi:hypothetical protein